MRFYIQRDSSALGRAMMFLIILLAAPSSLRVCAASPPGDSVNFDRDIRPILSENCFACHGPDEAKRKAKLRLDLHDEALKPAKSGERAIVPGHLEKSALWARVT